MRLLLVIATVFVASTGCAQASAPTHRESDQYADTWQPTTEAGRKVLRESRRTARFTARYNSGIVQTRTLDCEHGGLHGDAWTCTVALYYSTDGADYCIARQRIGREIFVDTRGRFQHFGNQYTTRKLKVEPTATCANG